MSPDRDKNSGAPGAGYEVKYSDRFLRERERKTRRGLLFGGLAFVVVGVLFIRESIIAHRTGELVAMGRRVFPVLPPFLAAPFGVVLTLAGMGALWALVVRRK